ncbi:hypothetical protein KW800_03030 [Candidatus Parcubacteria bacterium]|nr:hypothetical protein [Candidatus Parcubacteria bacterium]
MITTFIVGFAATILGWTIRPFFDKAQRIRGYRYVASVTKNFDEGSRHINGFREEGHALREVQNEFDVAMYPKMVELARTQEDLIWMTNNMVGGLHTKEGAKAFELFMRKRQELPYKADLLLDDRPKTRVATSADRSR